MKTTILITENGVPLWNDGKGDVHLPTQWRSSLKAEHQPIPPITFKQMKDSFMIEGDERPYGPGDFFCMIDGKAVGLTAAEFAEEWQGTGSAA